VVRRPAGARRICPSESECLELELLDEGVDGPHRVVFADEVVQTLGHQRHLITVTAFDVPGHQHLRRELPESTCSTRFHTVSAGSRPECAGRFSALIT
jgi:hypothetical protein